MPVRHPHADRDASPAAVTVDTTTYAVGDDGTIDCPPADETHVADVLAGAYECDAADLLVSETCEAVKADGEVCGRERPCRYHSDED
jgi:hypothetical protein